MNKLHFLQNSMKSFLKRIINNFLSLFTKEKEVVRTEQQITNDKYRDRYRLDFYDEWYFVQYKFNGDWWFLRKWEDDYVLEETRDKSLAFLDPNFLEDIITDHVKWQREGRLFLPIRNG